MSVPWPRPRSPGAPTMTPRPALPLTRSRRNRPTLPIGRSSARRQAVYRYLTLPWSATICSNQASSIGIDCGARTSSVRDVRKSLSHATKRGISARSAARRKMAPYAITGSVPSGRAGMRPPCRWFRPPESTLQPIGVVQAPRERVPRRLARRAAGPDRAPTPASAPNAQVLSRDAPCGERIPQPGEVIHGHIEVGDAETSGPHRLTEVQADPAVGAPAERQVVRPEGAPDAYRPPPAVGPGDVPARDVGKRRLGPEAPELGGEMHVVEPDRRVARMHAEEEQDRSQVRLDPDREVHVPDGTAARGSARAAHQAIVLATLSRPDTRRSPIRSGSAGRPAGIPAGGGWLFRFAPGPRG